MPLQKDTIYEGPISIIKTGKGFFSYDPNEEDLFIPGEALSGAFPGDTVKVQFTGYDTDTRTGKKKPSGKVIEVTERARETFVGKLVRNEEENLVMMIPDWKKMYVPFVVKGESLPIGHKVLIRFKGWNKHQPYPWGELEEIIGPAGVMGQPFWQPSGPNGYADDNAAWASAEGLKTRVDVAAGWGRQAAGSVADPRVLCEDVLGPLLSPETKQAVARAESKPQALALLLMSPEFQRR